MASNQTSTCSHYYELFDAWEKQSQKIDVQMRLLSLDLRFIGTKSNTQELQAKVIENEQCLKNLIEGAKEITKQLEKEASIQRKKLSKNDLDKASQVKSTFSIQLKKVDKLIKEINEAKKQYPDSPEIKPKIETQRVDEPNSNTLFGPEIKESKQRDIRRREKIKELKITSDRLTNELLEETKKLQSIETDLNKYRRDVQEIKPDNNESCITKTNDINTSIHEDDSDFPDTLYISWEQHTQMIDQQVKILSDKIPIFGTKLDTLEFRDIINVNEIHLCELVRNVKHITIDLGCVIPHHRDNLSKIDLNMIKTVQTNLGIALKSAQEVTKKITKLTKKFPKSIDETLDYPEVEDFHDGHISMYLKLEHGITTYNQPYVTLSSKEELQLVQTDIEKCYQQFHDYRNWISAREIMVNKIKSNVTEAIDYEKFASKEIKNLYKSLPERKRKPTVRKFLCGF